MSNHQKAILALVIANIIWGAASPIFKWSLDNVQPFTLAFLRFGLGTLLILPFVIQKLSMKKLNLIMIFLIAFSGITVNIAFFFLGLELAPSINAPIIATSGPVFLLIASSMFFKEKLKTKIVLGTLLSFLGVGLIVLQPIFEKGLDVSFVGDMFFIIATIAGIIHTILSKKIANTYEPLVFTFWTFLVGALTFIPMFGWEINKFGFLNGLNFSGIIGIIFGVIFCSVIAYFFLYWSIKHLHAQEVGIFTNLNPIIAVIVAFFLLQEIPTPTYLIGGSFVLLGIFLAEGRLPHHPLNLWNKERVLEKLVKI